MNKHGSIVILTGAGISAESGINTFRASDGLWENHAIEDVATPEAFNRDPSLVHEFYNQRRKPLIENTVLPNKAHLALAQLESEFAGDVLVVTQNIDNLHEEAGSKNVLHMHGEALKIRCQQSNQVFPCHTYLSVESVCECCNQSGQLRPHIVWFGEMPFYMDEIYSSLEKCTQFVAIGTSGNVYPASGFVEVANLANANTLELNLEKSLTATQFSNGVYGKATDIVVNWVESILKN